MTPAAARASLARMLASGGRRVVFRRVTDAAAGTFFEAEARARVTGWHGEPLVADLEQGARRLIVCAADLEAARYQVPPRRGDLVRLEDGAGAAWLTVETVDGTTRAIGATVIAWIVTAKGE